MQISTIGIDLAKTVFQIHAVDADGTTVIRKRLRRAEVLSSLAGLEPCRIGMEACATSQGIMRAQRSELDRRLCGCHEYRGYSIVYSGRRSLHFHFFFQTKHLSNAPWEAKASPRKDAGPETAALMQNVHNLYWDHARTAIEEILDPSRPVDPQMRSLTKWRRMPWAIRGRAGRSLCVCRRRSSGPSRGRTMRSRQ
jgi:hypothetical protein